MEDRLFLVFKELLKNDKFKESFILGFRLVVGDRLVSCADIEGVLGSIGIVVNGEDSDLTYELIVNTLILIQPKSSDIVLSDDVAFVLSKRYGKTSTKGTLGSIVEWYCSLMGLEKDGGTLEDSTEELEDGYEEEDITEVLEDDSTEEKDDFSKIKDDIKKYYNQYYKGVVSELSKRYTSLFESGYEVTKPEGVLSVNGLLGLSGSSLKIKKSNVAIKTIYNMLQDKLDFVEMDCRSNILIADSIYNAYSGGTGKLLYFPYKLLEYAYGRNAPSGDNQNSVNTYEVHSSASNWGAYCKEEIYKSLMAVVGSSVVKFIYESASGGNYYEDNLAELLQNYLIYLKKCLSLCLLMVDFKSKTSGVNEDVFAFKLRVCDPADSLGYSDITDEIIRKAFMGATGEVPFTYKPRFESEVLVKEYAHEFNHDSSQAMPLFAYKAFLALQSQNVEPTWNNMILGMFEDGTILKNGKHGVSLNTNLTHHICAGSRAGKGVMTLNVLASGIYSNRNIFYLDRKPDMASMMKYLSPNMFVVNGAAYSSNDDKPYYTWENQNSLINKDNIPDYLVNDVLHSDKSWESLGDIFYMRALKLVMGIIMIRGSGHSKKAELGGEGGILLVTDEFSNFNREFNNNILTKMFSSFPAKDLFKDKTSLEVFLEKKKGDTDNLEYKQMLSKFNTVYNDGAYYSLSFVKSLVEDLEYLKSKKDAGFSPEEARYSDIISIGQSLELGFMDLNELSSLTFTERYGNMGSWVTGLTKAGLTLRDTKILKSSAFLSMISFKTADAFFGRNVDEGRSIYLAQEEKESKANGRLDAVANNFAYLNSFSEGVRSRIVNEKNVKENIEIANRCIYFKPFLVLNDAKKGDNYTETLFSRCAGPDLDNPIVSREEIIEENPNSDRSFVNEAVGFEGYLNLMGISNYAERLEKSSDIANYVVKTCFNYPGTWFDFITDLRPEWMFTIEDVVNGYIGEVDIVKSDRLREFVEFNPSLFGGNGLSDENTQSSGMSVSDFMDEEDYPFGGSGEDYPLDGGNYSEGSIQGNTFSREFSTDTNQGVGSTPLEEDMFYTKPLEEPKDVIEREDEVQILLDRLKELGVDITPSVSRFEEEYDEDENYGGRKSVKVGDGYKEFDSADVSELDGNLEYSGGIESYEDLLRTVTNDVLNKFGGLGNIVSLKVIGGSLVVNGYYYRCRLNDLYARGIPYDVKREINSGNICRLFDYSLLRKMPKLRDLEFDSTSFVYDYVSQGLGFGSRVSVDLFFGDLDALQCLCIGGKLFRRSTYREQLREDDTFYQPRLASMYADYSNKLLKQATNSSWDFTKKAFNAREYGLLVRTVGVAGGLVATGVTGSSRLALKGGRKLTRKLSKVGRTIKSMLDESKTYR